MKRRTGGLKLFGSELDSGVINEILNWEDDPELGRILANLRSHTSRKAFFDTFAEAMVARRLIACGYALRFEVPTPGGRRCDFEVLAGDEKFYLHIKRVESDQPVRNPRQLMSISSRLRVLERIARPYIVQVRWHDGLSAEQMQRLVTQASVFITHARVGDEMKARGDDGREIGGVRIIAPWEGTHVNVTIGLPTGFVDMAPRFKRLMQRAYQQFMPKAVNVIVICSGHESEQAEFETALLGSHIERWDAFPPRGKRLAHGRAADGFWHGMQYAESQFAAWMGISQGTDAVTSRLWMRRPEQRQPQPAAALERLFAPAIR